jgi:hypothetical protein
MLDRRAVKAEPKKLLWWLRQAGILFIAFFILCIPFNVVEATKQSRVFEPEFFIAQPCDPLVGRNIDFWKFKTEGWLSILARYSSIFRGEPRFVQLREDTLINDDASQINPLFPIAQGRPAIRSEGGQIGYNEWSGRRVSVDHSWSANNLFSRSEDDLRYVIATNGIFVSCCEDVGGRFTGVSELETDNRDLVVDFDAPFIAAESSPCLDIQRFFLIDHLLFERPPLTEGYKRINGYYYDACDRGPEHSWIIGIAALFFGFVIFVSGWRLLWNSTGWLPRDLPRILYGVPLSVLGLGLLLWGFTHLFLMPSVAAPKILSPVAPIHSAFHAPVESMAPV